MCLLQRVRISTVNMLLIQGSDKVERIGVATGENVLKHVPEQDVTGTECAEGFVIGRLHCVHRVPVPVTNQASQNIFPKHQLKAGQFAERGIVCEPLFNEGLGVGGSLQKDTLLSFPSRVFEIAKSFEGIRGTSLISDFPEAQRALGLEPPHLTVYRPPEMPIHTFVISAKTVLDRDDANVIKNHCALEAAPPEGGRASHRFSPAEDPAPGCLVV